MSSVATFTESIPFQSIAPGVRQRNESSRPFAFLVFVQPRVTQLNQTSNASELGTEIIACDGASFTDSISSDAHSLVQEISALISRRLGNAVTPLALSEETRPIAMSKGILEFKGLTIDRAGREVRLGDEPIFLSKGEFELLAFMADHPGVVFSRRQLLCACCRDRLADDRSIDVQVFGLRKKLGMAGHHVQTARGVGYRFVADPNEFKRLPAQPR